MRKSKWPKLKKKESYSELQLDYFFFLSALICINQGWHIGLISPIPILLILESREFHAH